MHQNIRPLHESTIRRHAPAAYASPKAQAHLPRMTSNGSRAAVVAVVDDDIRVRESLDELLTFAGYRVRCYHSAEEFLSTRRFGEVACLLCDVMMPGMGGLDLLRALRTERSDLPVIFITAHGGEQITTSAMKMGAISVFAKPFNGPTLLKAVHEVIARHPT